MSRIRAWVKSFFGFSRTETNGFLILLPFLLVILFIEPIYQAWFTSRPLNISADRQLLDSITASWEFTTKTETRVAARVAEQTNAFKFDPNVSSVREFIELGFKENIATRIVNFRAKGGRFLIKADLKKIYGIDTALVVSLYPLIVLPEKTVRPEQKKLNEQSKPATRNLELIDINQADTSQLVILKGIGSKLSSRIIKYRDRLGGFVSQNQLAEVYGLDSLTVLEIRNNTFISPEFIPRQINVNKATQKELAALPYIKFPLAKAIVAYRFQHGSFTTIDELRGVAVFDEATFTKCKPYLTVKE
jgi:competence protein ComEA